MALRFVGLEQHCLRAAWRELDAGIGASVSDHHLAEQAPQLLGLTRLMRALSVNESLAKLFRRWELSRLKQGDQVIKFFERILHRRGGQQQEELARQRVDRLPGQRVAVAQVMRLVHHQQVPGH